MGSVCQLCCVFSWPFVTFVCTCQDCCNSLYLLLHDTFFLPRDAVHKLDMGVAEFKSARRWKKNLTPRRAEVQVSRIWFAQVK